MKYFITGGKEKKKKITFLKHDLIHACVYSSLLCSILYWQANVIALSSVLQYAHGTDSQN